MAILNHFPLERIREKQEKALLFIERAIELGYKDIVLALPTGSGKTALGVTLGTYSQEIALNNPESDVAVGAYYLCTQKLLQDQIEHDIPKFHNVGSIVSIKSASEYKCPRFGNCKVGKAVKKKGCFNEGCQYKITREAFEKSSIGVTNYPYLFTEKLYVGKLPKRKFLIMDECHSIESQIIRFVDVTISPSKAKTFAPSITEIPEFSGIADFLTWVKGPYLKEATAHLQTLMMLAEDAGSDGTIRRAMEAKQHVEKIIIAVDSYGNGEHEWVYWKAETEPKTLGGKGETEHIMRPVSAAPFFKKLLADSGSIRIYMSAFPGVKSVFCKSLGLNVDEVAWASFGSTFKADNRKVVIAPIGSLSKRNMDASLPSILRVVGKIMDKHAGEKGIIHSVSYHLGKQVYDHFQKTQHASRINFNTDPEKRTEAYLQHRDNLLPSVIVSPSMTEGFDFADDQARFQIILKVPYLYLGDRQVQRKLELDENWYKIQAVSTIIQAAGRIVRNENDYGITYIFDADFERLYRETESFWPKWFKSAIIFK